MIYPKIWNVLSLAACAVLVAVGIVIVLVLSLLLAEKAHSKQIFMGPAQFISSGDTLVMRGEIVVGSAKEFNAALRRYHPRIVEFDSGGGLIPEAIAMAELIHEHRLVVRVGADQVCASACFVMFAAGAEREVSGNSRIGVHRAKNSAGDLKAEAISTDGVAVRVATYGTTPLIVGLMVTTFQPDMAWLTPDQLAAMHHIRFIP